MDELEKRLKKYALYLLGRRAYSQGEMQAKLKEKMKSVLNACNVSKVDKDGVILVESKNLEELAYGNRTRDLSTRQASLDGVEMTHDIERIIQYLKSLNLLDDVAYAKSLAESLLRQSKSRRYIENKLKIKKIDKDIIEQVLVNDEEKESDSLSKLITSKLRHSPTLLSTPKGKAKLIRFLLYRGFSYGDVRSTIDQMQIDR